MSKAEPNSADVIVVLVSFRSSLSSQLAPRRNLVATASQVEHSHLKIRYLARPSSIHHWNNSDWLPSRSGGNLGCLNLNARHIQPQDVKLTTKPP